MALLLFLLPALASVSSLSAAEERAVCLRRLTFNGQPPQNQREDSFKSCKNHAENTCCYPQHTELVQRRLSGVADSKECSRVSEEVLCVLCDARFGTGALESKGRAVLCPQLCEKWFNACQEVYVSVAPSGSSSALTFCSSESLICSPLSATMEDSLSFCKGMGYEVLDEETHEETAGIKQRNRRCFDGVPVASVFAAPKRVQPVPTREEAGEEDWWSWFEGLGLTLNELVLRPELWLLAILLTYFIYQGVQQAKHIVEAQLNQERQQHRQQILLRYGVQEEEEEAESCNVSSEEEVAAEGSGDEAAQGVPAEGLRKRKDA